MSVHLNVNLSACSSHLYVYLSIYASSSVCLFIYMLVHRYVCLYERLQIFPSVCMSIFMSVHPFVCPSAIFPSVLLSVSMPSMQIWKKSSMQSTISENLSVHLPDFLLTYPSFCLSVWLDLSNHFWRLHLTYNSRTAVLNLNIWTAALNLNFKAAIIARKKESTAEMLNDVRNDLATMEEELHVRVSAGNTEGGSINVQLTFCLTGLD